jgi:hypothetical protein
MAAAVSGPRASASPLAAYLRGASPRGPRGALATISPAVPVTAVRNLRPSAAACRFSRCPRSNLSDCLGQLADRVERCDRPYLAIRRFIGGQTSTRTKAFSITHPAVWASIPQRCCVSVSLSKGNRMSAAAFPKVGLEAMLTPDNRVPVLINHQPFQVAAVLLLPEWPAATGRAHSEGASA